MNNGIMAATLQSSPAKEPAVRMEELRRQLAALEAAAAVKCGRLLWLRNPATDGAVGGGRGAGAAVGMILDSAPDETPSAAVTRWSIGAARDAERCHSFGPPRFLARLLRNRRGPLGTWMVEWNSVEQRFELATHSEPVAGAAFDRPHRTAVA